MLKTKIQERILETQQRMTCAFFLSQAEESVPMP